MNQEQRELQLTAFRELISLMGNEAQLLTSSGASYPIKGKFSKPTKHTSLNKGRFNVVVDEITFEAEYCELDKANSGDLLIIEGSRYRIVSQPVFDDSGIGFVRLSDYQEPINETTNFL